MKKILVRRLIARYFRIPIILLYKIRFQFTKFNSPPILIFTPGKVGSSSVEYTLKQKLKSPVFHIHYLTQNGIENSIKQHMKSDRKSIPMHLIISKFLRRKLEKYKGDVYIITIVREPIAREVSSFFQNIEIYKDSLEGKGLQINEVKAVEVLRNQLTYKITANLEEWFNSELHEQFGIDVFDYSLDELSKGFKIIEKGRNKVLLLKMETMNQYFGEAISAFLNIQDSFELKNSNIGELKHYAKTYENVKGNLKIEEDNLLDILSSKYFQHFYALSTSEVREKWLKHKNTGDC